MKFELLSGSHYDKKGKLHQIGSIIESDKDLNILFPGRFRVITETITSKPDSSSSPPAVEGVSSAVSTPSTDINDDSKDVTSDFPLAKEIGGVKVVLTKEGYNVIDIGNNQYLNEKPFLNEKKVNKFLNHFIDDD